MKETIFSFYNDSDAHNFVIIFTHNREIGNFHQQGYESTYHLANTVFKI